MRLIDADELLNVLCTSSYPQDMDIGKAYYIFEKELKNAPTVDAVPVVRCVECKYLDESLAMGGWDGSCRYWNTHSTVYSGFCSFGEKVTE